MVNKNIQVYVPQNTKEFNVSRFLVTLYGYTEHSDILSIWQERNLIFMFVLIITIIFIINIIKNYFFCN